MHVYTGFRSKSFESPIVEGFAKPTAAYTRRKIETRENFDDLIFGHGTNVRGRYVVLSRPHETGHAVYLVGYAVNTFIKFKF